jgi:hypothetical protein
MLATPQPYPRIGGANLSWVAESKRRGHDRIRSSQLSFLDAALAAGLSIQSLFLIVEWTLRE